MRLTEFIRAPLVAGALFRRNNTELRVEYTVHLAVGQLNTTRLLPGESAPDGTQYLQMAKAVHPETNQPVELSFDASGEEVDGRSLLNAVNHRRFEKYGRLHPSLYDYLSNIDGEADVPIAVWAPIDRNFTNYEKPTAILQGPPEAEIQAMNRTLALKQSISGNLTYLGASNITSPDDIPIVYAVLSSSQVTALAQADYVGVVLLDVRGSVNDLINSIQVAHSDQAHNLGYDGTGIRVAVFENGPDDTTYLDIADFATITPPPGSPHARLTHAIIKNKEPAHPHGHAPGCTLYSANDDSNESLFWAVRFPQSSTVVSQSFHRDGEEPNGVLQGDDLIKDWLALRYPYPTIVQAAGNFDPGEVEYVNHKGYNTISVGSHDDAATSISGFSTFLNPITSHGDRELPDIAANGETVSAVGLTGWSGTSFAAPAVAGITALLQQVNGILQFWPEGIRAILFASANRGLEGTTWWDDVVNRVDAAVGAGAADAFRGVQIAKSYQTRDNPSVERGWGIGTFTSGDVDQYGYSTFKYNIKVPGDGNEYGTCKVKVALAWDSKVTDVPVNSILTVDLDLIVRDSHGTWVASSVSWDNSEEIVEFDGTKGGCYEIIIRRWSGTDSVWYGVAWTHV